MSTRARRRAPRARGIQVPYTSQFVKNRRRRGRARPRRRWRRGRPGNEQLRRFQLSPSKGESHMFKSVLAVAVTLGAVGFLAQEAAAGEVKIKQKCNSQCLRSACAATGGSFGSGDASSYCFNNSKGTSVVCSNDGTNCVGWVPRSRLAWRQCDQHPERRGSVGRPPPGLRRQGHAPRSEAAERARTSRHHGCEVATEAGPQRTDPERPRQTMSPGQVGSRVSPDRRALPVRATVDRPHRAPGHPKRLARARGLS